MCSTSTLSSTIPAAHEGDASPATHQSLEDLHNGIDQGERDTAISMPTMPPDQRPDPGFYARREDYVEALEAYTRHLEAVLEAGRVPTGVKASEHAGARLAAARERADLTQREAGETIGKSPSRWSQMESGIGNLNKFSEAAQAIGGSLLIEVVIPAADPV